jgi:hypothetical protein
MSGESKLSSSGPSSSSSSSSSVRGLLSDDARAAAFDDATVARFLARTPADPRAAAAALRKALYVRGAIGLERIRLDAARATADAGFICLLDRATSAGDVIMLIKWSLYDPAAMPCAHLIVVMVSYFEEALRRLGGRGDGKLVVWLDYKDWKLSQSDNAASKVLIKVLEALYCNVMRSVVMVHCNLMSRGLIKIFKAFSSKSLMSRVHVCAHVATALERSRIDLSMLPPLYGGSNVAFDVKASVAAIVAHQGDGSGTVAFEARDDFSHFYKVAGRQLRATGGKTNSHQNLNSKDVLALGDQVKLTGTMRIAQGLFGTLAEYGFALAGPLLYTWEAPRRAEAGAPVHKIMEVCGASAAAHKGAPLILVVEGYTANGDIVTWMPRSATVEECAGWVAAINDAVRVKRRIRV